MRKGTDDEKNTQELSGEELHSLRLINQLIIPLPWLGLVCRVLLGAGEGKTLGTAQGGSGETAAFWRGAGSHPALEKERFLRM